MKKINVLLIDDDTLFLLLTEKMLKKASILEQIKSYSSVNEAQAYLDSCLTNGNSFPDAIFVDMNMPGMNGIEFANLYSQKYASHYPKTKLVILTSSISRKEKVQALDIPVVSDFIQKPLTEKKILNLLEQ